MNELLSLLPAHHTIEAAHVFQAYRVIQFDKDDKELGSRRVAVNSLATAYSEAVNGRELMRILFMFVLYMNVSGCACVCVSKCMYVCVWSYLLLMYVHKHTNTYIHTLYFNERSSYTYMNAS